MNNSSPGLGQMRIPDILETIADLSNDEVFTPPDLANKVLDMLPESIWSDSSVTFLDPATKTGVFLREITKRLIAGLESEIPDLQERVNHILTKQVYGLGITQLTSLMSRRTLYCSTKANGIKSVCTEFDDIQGNVKFPFSEHTFNKNRKCEVCGAPETLYYNEEGLDNYAYSFLHDKLKEVFGDVKFDVIVGNPPYQLNLGNEGANSSRSISVYHKFIDKALDLKPEYIAMITPSRWMTKTASGIPEEWSDKMINSRKISKIHDFEDGDSLFSSSVGVNGGISYFLIDSNYNGDCDFTYYPKSGPPIRKKKDLNSMNADIILRDPRYESIIHKIEKKEGKYYKKDNRNFKSLVGSIGYNNESSGRLSSSWRNYSLNKDDNNNIKYLVSKSTNKVSCGWISESDIPKNKEILEIDKLYIPAANGTSQVLGKPRFGPVNSVASETYIPIGASINKAFTLRELKRIMEYISTKTFRFLVKMKKNTQNGAKGVYQFVPLIKFNTNEKITDEFLYEKYSFSKEEIDLIENSVKEMDISREKLEITITERERKNKYKSFISSLSFTIGKQFEDLEKIFLYPSLTLH